jgi:hypothetical protein
VFLRRLLTATNEDKSSITCALSLLAIFFFASVGRTTALDPHTLISQYGHTAWRAQDGVIGDAGSITQTTDGYIWMWALSAFLSSKQVSDPLVTSEHAIHARIEAGSRTK